MNFDMRIFSLFLFFNPTAAFLLDGPTPASSGLSDKHYVTLMNMVVEEMKARQQLEVYITELHRELIDKTSNLSSNVHQDQTCHNCSNRIQMLETEITTIKNDNTELKRKYETIFRDFTDMKSENKILTTKLNETEVEVNSLKQLKAIDQIKSIQTVGQDMQIIKQQVSALQNTQLARSQDFLALYNQTMVNKAETVAMKKELINQHNKSVTDLSKNISALAIQQNQSVNQILEKIKMSEMILNNSLVAVTSTITQLRTQVDHDSQARGTTYVRWSRTQCPNDADLVYAGYAGGGRYNEEGSAAEPVCLPKDPEFNKTSGADNGGMYGAGFNSNLFASNSKNQDVPCAVCRTRSSTSVIMIPGKTNCHTGWRQEYYGYLSSGYYADKAANTYVCIDINPEYVPGGSARNGNSKLFYEVIAKCGSLKCPPYHDGYPLTCVVCSK